MVVTSFPSSSPPVLSPQTSSSSRHSQILEKLRTHAARPAGNLPFRPVAKGCRTCGGKGAVECPGCKGTGKNKKNGNIFERWKCFDCQGFGLKSCPSCGKGGLTPEQRGER